MTPDKIVNGGEGAGARRRSAVWWALGLTLLVLAMGAGAWWLLRAPTQHASGIPAGTESHSGAKDTAVRNFVSADLFKLPEDLEITLWAYSPQLRNPTNLDIDAQGRIWVTEGVNYRYNATRDPAGDRVVVLEDRDRDGVAETSTVFVQEPGLIAPLGIAVIDNQIVVSTSPNLIVYTDVDHNRIFDPAVDKREVLLTGFRGRNHDHSLHSLTVGPDGRWYFNQGNTGANFVDRGGRRFRASDADGGEEAAQPSDDGRRYVGGFAVRMRPDGSGVEIIGHNFRNSYEQAISSFGDVFQNDNDDSPASRTSFLLEYGNAGFRSADGTRRWSADRRPGQSASIAHWRQQDPGVMPAGDIYGGGAPTGIVLNEGDALGPRWRGVLFSADAARNTILGYRPRAEGAGYALEHFDFLTSNQAQQFAGTDFKDGETSSEIGTHFRPSDIAVGPDGALYVADWFDARVGGHKDLDRSVSGAIYRIAPKGFKPAIPPLDLTTIPGQIAALRNPAVNVRALGHARLRAQGPAALAPVAALLSDRNPYVRARAVWLLAELGDDGVRRVEALLRDDDPMLRIAAFRALRRIDHQVLAHARQLADDPSPAVRREVALALRDVPLARSRELLLRLAQGYDGRDRTYLEAWGIGASGKEASLYAALAATQTQTDPLRWTPAYADLVWRLTPAAAAGAFAARAASERLPEAQRLAAVTALGFVPTREAARSLLDLAKQGDGVVARHALWWLLNYKDSRWRTLGLDAELKRRGLYDPETIKLVEWRMPAPPVARTLPAIADIARLRGDPQRGAGRAQVCLMCHRIGERGVDYGPALDGFARRQTTEVVISAIVDPSTDIAHGYTGRELVTKEGVTIQGLVMSTSTSRELPGDPPRVIWSGPPTVMQGMGGATQIIPAERIATRQLMERSLMLGAEQLGLSAQDVADIAAYLKTQ